jgi:hypothetical protein
MAGRMAGDHRPEAAAWRGSARVRLSREIAWFATMGGHGGPALRADAGRIKPRVLSPGVNPECDRRIGRRILCEARPAPWSDLRLQLMILLSALLASLTGLVVGERPAARAQVELSAASALAEPARATPAATRLFTAAPAMPALRLIVPSARHAAPVRTGRNIRDLKQSWLI